MITLSVHSSFIVSAAYNEERQWLRIQIGNRFYYYHGVTMQKVARFKKAASKGSYFCNYIKGKYQMTTRKMNNQNLAQ